MGLILVFDGNHLRRSGLRRALRDHDLQVAADLLDIPHQVLGHIDDVRRKVAQRAQPGGLFKAVPVNVRQRVGHVVFVVGAVEVDHLANLAAGDNLLRQLRGRVLHVVEPHQRFHPGPLRGIDHRARVVGVKRQRLLRVDVLAVADRLQRHLFMQMVG